jgi:lipoprotein-releasing system ATP-binding protein
MILEVRGVSHDYETDRPVLDSIDLTVGEGESVAVCGRSGVGKTTLLEILGTMRTPRSGSVVLKGESVYEVPVRERARLRGEYHGFVFQDGHLLPDLSVWENCRLAVALSPRDWSMDRVRSRFERLMEDLGLPPGRGDQRPGQFSTGERQRIAVVRALIHDPALLMADEPTGNLDPTSSDQLIDVLKPLLEEEDMGILVATHDRHLAQSLERVKYLRNGKLSDQAEPS